MENQISNDVVIRHCGTGVDDVAHVTELVPFHPSVLDDRDALTQARSAAELDSDQILIKQIDSVSGDYNKRSTLVFKVTFSDDTVQEKQFDQDLAQTIQYEQFIRSQMQDKPYLEPLLHSIKDWRAISKTLKEEDVKDVPKGTILYTFLHSYGYGWYKSLDLPDIEDREHVVALISKGLDAKTQKLKLYSEVFKSTYQVDNEYLRLYTVNTLSEAKHVLVDKAFAKRYPQVQNR
jgi:hypothetical protein